MMLPPTSVRFIANPDRTAMKGLPDDLQVGLRKIYVLAPPEGKFQYLIYRAGWGPETDKGLHNVLASGETLEIAAETARRMLNIENLKPVEYFPRLSGCRFEVDRDHPDHNKRFAVVILDTGAIVYGSDRAAACRNALGSVLSGLKDITREEFAHISCTVQVSRGMRKGEKDCLYDRAEDMDRLKILLASAMACSPAIAESAKKLAHENGPGMTPLEAVFRSCRSLILKSALAEQIKSFDISTDDGLWTGHVVVHQASVPAQTALDLAYAQFVSDEHSPEASPAPSAS